MQASVAEASVAEAAAAQGNKDIDDLYKLERVHAEQLMALQKSTAADPEFERERQELLRAMVDMVKEHKVHSSVVYLAAAMLDLCHVLRKGQEYNLQVQALAVFVLSVKFNGTYTKELSLSAFCKSWKQRLGIRHDAFAVRHVRAAEVELFELLEWRLNVATANRFLEAFLATHVKTDDLLNEWAAFFVDLGVMHMRFTAYAPSVLALASILASRSMLDLEPVGAPELVTLYGATSVQDMLHPCVQELLEHYNTHVGNTQAPQYKVLYTFTDSGIVEEDHRMLDYGLADAR